MTVAAYIRQCRVRRARHLLLHSWLPIKTIGRQVGIPNPQHFSKTIRQEWGASPSDLRERGADE
jgi:transcriptional regulator GlxA family with amidase domain